MTNFCNAFWYSDASFFPFWTINQTPLVFIIKNAILRTIPCIAFFYYNLCQVFTVAKGHMSIICIIVIIFNLINTFRYCNAFQLIAAAKRPYSYFYNLFSIYFKWNSNRFIIPLIFYDFKFSSLQFHIPEITAFRFQNVHSLYICLLRLCRFHLIHPGRIAYCGRCNAKCKQGRYYSPHIVPP